MQQPRITRNDTTSPLRRRPPAVFFRDISSLTKGCWGLEVLNVGGNDSLGDQVLESALADCTRLRLLRMHG